MSSTPEQRAALLHSFQLGYTDLMQVLEPLPEALWRYRPGPHSWNVHQILVHLADSEAKAYVRCRSIIAESGGRVMAYNQDLWSEHLNYEDQPREMVLELFRLLRELNYRLVAPLPEATWAHYTHHSERGKLTLDDWLQMYERHVHLHLDQIRRNLAHWLQHGQQSGARS